MWNSWRTLIKASHGHGLLTSFLSLCIYSGLVGLFSFYRVRGQNKNQHARLGAVKLVKLCKLINLLIGKNYIVTSYSGFEKEIAKGLDDNNLDTVL